MHIRTAVAAGALLLTAVSTLHAQTPLRLHRVAFGFSSALYMTQPPGDLERMFVVEQGGKIRVHKNNAINATPFLDVGISGLNKITSGGERGLLGLAFHPDYANNGFFYVNYTNLGGHTVIERYKVSANPDVADSGSGFIILGPITQPFSNHNGGCLQFGPDGKLYCGMGDGGSGNDPMNNAQTGSTLLGKFLRLDVDNPPTYVPSDNPFVGSPSINPLIWHFGERNPWRFSFDQATGDMYIGDVGQDAWEEISFQPAGMGGLNYGWRCMEGFNCTGLTGCTCNSPTLRLPIHAYAQAPGCNSVTGGYVYRGCAIPDLVGTYFFGDYCRRLIWSFEYDGTTVSNFQNRTSELVPNAGSIGAIPSFATDPLGEVYVVDTDEIFKIVPQNMADCNGNGVADACDIALGTSPDANMNGVPDECDCFPGTAYCTAKVTSGGCVPAISSTGQPSLGGSFIIHGNQIEPNQLGVLFYGINGPASTPFQGGFLCVVPPVTRLPPQNSGGGAPCSGTFAVDFSGHLLFGGDPALVVSQSVWAQYWFRDPGVATGTGLSDALSFTICQ